MPKPARRFVECQERRGALGGVLREAGASLGLARAEPVHGHGIWLGSRRRFEDLGEAAVVLPHARLGQARDDGLADPIVDRLDGLAAVAKALSDEALRGQVGHRVVDRVDRGGAREARQRQGSAAHGDDLDESPDIARKSREAVAHDLSERDSRDAGCAQPLGGAPGELFDEERASARLAHDGVDDVRVGLIARGEERDGERAGVVRVERTDDQLVGLGARRPASLELRQEGNGPRFFVAMSQNKEDWRRVRRTDDLEQQERAVGISPLHVVDVDHERLSLRQRREKLAQRLEGAAAHPLRIAGRSFFEIVDGGHSPQDGEEPGQ